MLIGEQLAGVGVPENCTPGWAKPEPKHSRVLLCSWAAPEQLEALPAVSSIWSQLPPTGDPQVHGPQVADPDEPVYQGTADAPPGQVVFIPSNSWQTPARTGRRHADLTGAASPAHALRRAEGPADPEAELRNVRCTGRRAGPGRGDERRDGDAVDVTRAVGRPRGNAGRAGVVLVGDELAGRLPLEVLPVHSARVLNPASVVVQLTGPGLQLQPWPATIVVQLSWFWLAKIAVAWS